MVKGVSNLKDEYGSINGRKEHKQMTYKTTEVSLHIGPLLEDDTPKKTSERVRFVPRGKTIRVLVLFQNNLHEICPDQLSDVVDL